MWIVKIDPSETITNSFLLIKLYIIINIIIYYKSVIILQSENILMSGMNLETINKLFISVGYTYYNSNWIDIFLKDKSSSAVLLIYKA